MTILVPDLHAIVVSKEITYIDTYKLLSNKEKYFSNPNSYYPNKLGYQKIFQEIIYQMKKDLKN